MSDLVSTGAARGALHGLTLPQREGRVAISDAGPAGRFVYRGDPHIISVAFALELPTEPCRSTTCGARAALWLGPDEWLLILPMAERETVSRALRAAVAGRSASLVDVSHRNEALLIAGPAAARLLNAGCPLDLDLAAFPVGMCARTLFAKAEIVLWRAAPTAFRVELWRSFAPYIVGHLAAAASDVE